MAKKERRRQDHLARQAHSEGYRARSVYKIEEIDRKYPLFRTNGLRVLDLGAAPGSWTQYAIARGSAVVAVDLQELSIAGATCIRGDFTDTDVVSSISTHGPYDLVISDAAPSTTGNRLVDTGRSEALVESILAGLHDWITPGGSFVAKLFQGGGDQALRKEVRERFAKGVNFRPLAVRRESCETYLVGLGYRGYKSRDALPTTRRRRYALPSAAPS